MAADLIVTNYGTVRVGPLFAAALKQAPKPRRAQLERMEANMLVEPDISRFSPLNKKEPYLVVWSPFGRTVFKNVDWQKNSPAGIYAFAERFERVRKTTQ